MAGFAFVDYRKLREWAIVFYPGSLVLLAGVLVLGQNVKGAQAWFGFGPFQLQPSEPSKLALIIVVSAYLSSNRSDLGLVRLVAALAVAGLPMGLILLQPDLGTVLVFVVVTLTLLAVAGVRARYLMGLLVLGVVGTVEIGRAHV